MIIPPIADHQLFKGYADGSLRFAEASWGPYLQQLRTDRGETLLHLTSDPATLSALLAVGLDPNARDCDGRTPLMRYRSAAANRVLIEGGAFPNEVDSMGQIARWTISPAPWTAASATALLTLRHWRRCWKGVRSPRANSAPNSGWKTPAVR